MDNSPNDKQLEMPFLRNIGLLMTYKCQVMCPHCILEAGPHRTEEAGLADAWEWIQQVAEYNNGYIKVLSLTGGEPFFNLDNLKAISSFAEDCGLMVSAVTNAFWASTPEKAIGLLQQLSAIKMLSISCDVYHQRHIPFERVQNAILAAQECNIPYTVAVCTDNYEDREYQLLLQKLTNITPKEKILTAITFPAGRALKSGDILNYQTTNTPPISACSAGSSPIIFPDGRIIACIGPVIDLASSHPLMLGNLRNESLQSILDRAQVNPILHAIRLWGPRKLIAMAEEAGLGQYLPQTYIEGSVCHACYGLMASEKLVEFLNKLALDFEFQRKVAYARLYYLEELEMLELMNIYEPETVFS
jgi:MoaA/NifB/PqqE/SkfB family radical SAM enzyme